MPELVSRIGKKKLSAVKAIKKHTFPIVAIGASAGGLEAITELLKYLPANTGNLQLIFKEKGVDFNYYKMPTVKRRIIVLTAKINAKGNRKQY